MNLPVFIERFGASSADPSRLGGKGASLSRLVGFGHRVPPGFVVTVDAFHETLSHLGLSSAFEELSAALPGEGELAPLGRRLAEGLKEGRVPPAVLDAITSQIEAMDLWSGELPSLIVRSSATAEDGATSSFAGIFESIPITSPDELEPTLRAVWASALAPRALSYARERGLLRISAMAIVIQRFLAADRSGVMFTEFKEPGGALRILVEHVEGDCEKLVKGEVTPDRLWIDREAPIPDDLEGPLLAAYARELTRLAMGLEVSFGGPQDVEWVVKDGLVHVVQSRPITMGAAPAQMDEGDLPDVEPLLRGVSASPGVASGEVHLGFNVDQVLDLVKGQVLVTPMTNPDMVVAMRSSAAIVTDVGGMICHAAIVSRELGLPCVVGTETATAMLTAGETITVSGTHGLVYRGRVLASQKAQAKTKMDGPDLWALWERAFAGHKNASPLVSTRVALDAMPETIRKVGLVPDIDLRATDEGLWCDLEAMTESERESRIDAYFAEITELAETRDLLVVVTPRGLVPSAWIDAALSRAKSPRLARQDDTTLPLHLTQGAPPQEACLVPLGSAALVLHGRTLGTKSPEQVGTLRSAAASITVFFGHKPGSKTAPMPDPEQRAAWWARLPDYARFHEQSATRAEEGSFEWLELRPEIVISSLLKSVVLPGFEMIPRALGLEGLPPLHIQWMKCRYHLREDVFTKVWGEIVEKTWDRGFLTTMLRDVRASYARFKGIPPTFPSTEAEWAEKTGPELVALAMTWWPHLVEFFSLNWFEQAQGDDIAYPFLETIVREHEEALGEAPSGASWPGLTELIAPTMAVQSGAYMADVDALREDLSRAGLTTRAQAEEALARGEHPAIEARIEQHLSRWHWMRDRDLLFEPWDTRGRVIETALKTEPHPGAPYAENRRHNLLALGFHFDLSMGRGFERELLHAARFLQDLRLEREDHHILWLRCSHVFRALALEVERRLVAVGSIAPGDVFFLQAPELLDAAARLPEPLPAGLIEKVKNRRAGYRREARMDGGEGPEPTREIDYY